MDCNQRRQTFTNSNKTIGLISLGFVTLVDGNIKEAGYSLRRRPKISSDNNFEIVIGNALGNIADDSETYKRMWKALNKESREFVESLGFSEEGINLATGQKYVREDTTVNPPHKKPKSLYEMSFEEFAEYVRFQEGLKKGMEGLKGALGL